MKQIKNEVSLNLLNNTSLGTTRQEKITSTKTILELREKFNKKLGQFIIINNEVGGVIIGTLTSFTIKSKTINNK